MTSAAMTETDLVSHYRATRARIVDRVVALDEAGASRTVPACPAWAIRDAVAHVTGIAVDLGAGRMPGSDTQAWIDGHVAGRKGLPLDRIVDEWLGAGVDNLTKAETEAQKSAAEQAELDVHRALHPFRVAQGDPAAHAARYAP